VIKMKSAFSSVHPVVSLLYFTGVAVMSMMLLHPVFLATSVCLLLLLNILQGSGALMKKMMMASISMAAIVAIANPLFTHRGSTMLFYLFDNPVTLEAIVYGITMALSFLTISFAFTSYNETISSHKFLYLFSRISPKAALLTMIAIRFVPLFLRRLSHITIVQKTKGVQLETGSLRNRARNGMKLLSVLLVCSLEEALQTADSMQARGFGTVKRSTYIRYRMTRRDWLLLSIFIILLLSCLVGTIFGAGVLSIYPKVEPLAFQRKDGVLYTAFCLYISIPIIIEGREWAWWHMQK